MSRLIRSSVPTDNAVLKPQMVGEHFEENDEMAKLRNAYSGKSLSSLQPGEEVYVPDREQFGHVKDQMHPRSYVVSTPSSGFRRNRKIINSMPPVQRNTGNESPEQLPQLVPIKFPLYKYKPPDTVIHSQDSNSNSENSENSESVITRCGNQVRKLKKFH